MVLTKVIIWGYGNMGKRILELILEEQDFLPIAIIGRNTTLVGNIPMITQEDANVYLLQADVCIIATRSSMEDLQDQFELCATNHTHAITIGEEALFPFNTSKTVTDYLDKLAKEYGVTLAGSGFQDIYWGHLVVTLAKSMHRIDRIVGRCQYNADDYGKILCEAHGVGLRISDFSENILPYPQSKNPPYSWNSCEYLSNILGWNSKKISHCLSPTFSEEDLYSKSLQRELLVSDASGMSSTVTLETREGPIIELTNIGKVYSIGDSDSNNWTLYGVPEKLTINLEDLNIPDLTCITVIKRARQLQNSQRGFIFFDKGL